MKNEHLVGIDLGTINDYTAVSVIERFGKIVDAWPEGKGKKWKFQQYRLWHLERYLGEPYTTLIENVQRLLERPELKGALIIVDATGVGRPVIDLMRERGLKHIVPVVFTGGESVSSDYVNGLKEWRAPKRDLVGVLQVLLQNQELKIPSSIELREDLITEMQNLGLLKKGLRAGDSWGQNRAFPLENRYI